MVCFFFRLTSAAGMTRVSRAAVKIGALFFSYFREALVIFHALAEVVNAVVFKLGKRGHGYHVGGVNDFDLGFFAGFLDYRADSEVGTFGDFGPYFYRDVGLDEILSVAFAGLFGNDQGEGHYSFDFSSCVSSHGCFCGCCTQILLVQIFFPHNCKFFMS
mgnify:CR=1 FL=1